MPRRRVLWGIGSGAGFALASMILISVAWRTNDGGETSHWWLIFGWGAQALFTGRFLVQWLASERAKRTVVPPSFWWLSLLGGLSLGVYFSRRGDPVGLAGQIVPLAIYGRNLWLIHIHGKGHGVDQDPGGAATEVDARPAAVGESAVSAIRDREQQPAHG